VQEHEDVELYLYAKVADNNVLYNTLFYVLSQHSLYQYMRIQDAFMAL